LFHPFLRLYHRVVPSGGKVSGQPSLAGFKARDGSGPRRGWLEATSATLVIATRQRGRVLTGVKARQAAGPLGRWAYRV